ncbi:MAG: alpha-amylase [Anaerolineae bacterium]|nr:alpha-amylase [Anaerolineae bacterium]
MNRLLTLLLCTIILISCQTASPEPTPTPNPLYTTTHDYPWWNDITFYEIFVRSFYDSDGDGIGDLNGLIEKLDYLNDGDPTTTDDLGITGIWLMPITVSPSYHGYDVVDYYQIDPDYGTNDDFKRLMEEAHKRGIRVIVDLVLNHTSTQHPWFQASTSPDSEYRDWYLWRDDLPTYRGPWGQPVWHRRGSSFYYGVFWDGMPDLNFENPAVVEAMFDVTRFWLEEMGVDGFRLDAIKHLIEDGSIQENSRATHAFMQKFYTYYKEVNPNAFTVGEAWTSTQQVLRYTGSEVDIAFQFDLAEAALNSVSIGVNRMVMREQQAIINAFPPGQYATFLTNHDQNRVMSHFNGDEGRARVAASWLLSSPGVPFIYYGEEIGLTGSKPDEDIRRPLHWTSQAPGVGFTTGTPWRAPTTDFSQRNIARQSADPDSLLSHYRTLVHLRNAHEALRVGEWLLVESSNARLYAYLRHTDDEVILVLLNLSHIATNDYTLTLSDGPLSGEITLVMLLGEGNAAAPQLNNTGGFNAYTPIPELPPHSSFIIRLK